MMAMALMYAPYTFSIIVEWIWFVFMFMYLVLFPAKKLMPLQNIALSGTSQSDLVMRGMNITLMITGLVEVGRKPVFA